MERLIAEIEESLKIAESITSLTFEEFTRDVRNRYTLRMVIVEVVEAAVNVGLYILREKLKVRSVEGYVDVGTWTLSGSSSGTQLPN